MIEVMLPGIAFLETKKGATCISNSSIEAACVNFHSNVKKMSIRHIGMHCQKKAPLLFC